MEHVLICDDFRASGNARDRRRAHRAHRRDFSKQAALSPLIGLDPLLDQMRARMEAAALLPRRLLIGSVRP